MAGFPSALVLVSFSFSSKPLKNVRGMSLLGLNTGLLAEGLLLGTPSRSGALSSSTHSVTPGQGAAGPGQCGEPNLMITSDSQKHWGQVAFLLVGLAHPTVGPGFPSALHQAEGTLRAWSGWGGARRTEIGCLGQLRVLGWGSETPLCAPSPPPEIDPDNTR